MRDILAKITLLFVLVVGCSAHQGKVKELVTSPGLESIVLSYDLSNVPRYWSREIKPEYPNALLVAVHGQTDMRSGEWYAYPSNSEPLPVTELVESIREDHPDRHIVLTICNPGGHELTGVSNVSYARETVWVMTDAEAGVAWRDVAHPDGVGSFEEFVHVD